MLEGRAKVFDLLFLPRLWKAFGFKVPRVGGFDDCLVADDGTFGQIFCLASFADLARSVSNDRHPTLLTPSFANPQQIELQTTVHC